MYSLLVANTTTTTVDPCTCTTNGTSGKINTGISGCVPLATATTVYYCYVIDPMNCALDTPSVRFPGAGLRVCSPTSKYIIVSVLFVSIRVLVHCFYIFIYLFIYY